MPKSKKTKSESTSSSDSGPDDKAPPPPAKKSKSEPAKVEKTEKEGKSWVLENLRMVRINEFKGRKSIDIREFYEKDGKQLPGKRGIALSMVQWQKLLEVADEVTAAAKE